MISSIVHIDHQYDNDSEPWTLEFEDADGTLHSVVLERGQVSFLFQSAVTHLNNNCSLRPTYITILHNFFAFVCMYCVILIQYDISTRCYYMSLPGRYMVVELN